jgi:hypothetical protein
MLCTFGVSPNHDSIRAKSVQSILNSVKTRIYLSKRNTILIGSCLNHPGNGPLRWINTPKVTSYHDCDDNSDWPIRESFVLARAFCISSSKSRFGYLVIGVTSHDAPTRQSFNISLNLRSG